MNDLVKWIDETIEDAGLSTEDYIKKYPDVYYPYANQCGVMKVVLENARREIVEQRKEIKKLKGEES